MISQKEIFKSTEGDGWFNRNVKIDKKTQNSDDLILQILQLIEIKPKTILEIGCSNGSRLNNLNVKFDSKCYGIDPSNQAIQDGKIKFPNITLQVSSADELPFEQTSFDMIIFGFCLYLCDRNDLFKIAYEADRCLCNNGYLVIYDFYPPFPYKNNYSHYKGIYSYKMNYAKMFSWNPVYKEIFNTIFSHSGYSQREIPDEKVAITILNKNEQHAYPTEPFRDK